MSTQEVNHVLRSGVGRYINILLECTLSCICAYICVCVYQYQVDLLRASG